MSRVYIDISDDEVFLGYYTRQDGINTYHDCKTDFELIEPKIGYWNTFEQFQGGIKETWYECSECKWHNALLLPRNYCPNCGCKMSD